MARRLREPLLVGAGMAAAAAALLVRDPHRTGSWGYCPFLLLSGHPCPGCGALRAANEMLHGQLTAALGSNAYVVASTGLGLALWVVWTVRRATGRRSDWRPVHGRLAYAWLAGLLLFGALRLLLPGLAFLQP